MIRQANPHLTKSMYPELTDFLVRFTAEAHLIPEPRKRQLAELVAYVKANKDLPVQLNFICTHNSRRSHLGMIWAAVAAAYYGLENVVTYSGGTEATAFNPRAVAALQRAGFRVDTPVGENPHYVVYFAADKPPLTCFSKVYDHLDNPQQDFAAIMTCSDADENCPLIPGAERRLPLTYEDPKVADDTAFEAERYDERVAQIGRELLYVFSKV
ncbi:MAG: arsenate reductase [Neolewinella sp.]|jgi:arsenate reductase